MGLLGIVSLFFGYLADKATNPEAAQILAQRTFLLALIIGILNTIKPLVDHFTPAPPDSAIKDDIRESLVEFFGEKPNNPTAKEADDEIDKELAVAFKEKKCRALELYEQGNKAYENNRFKESIPLFDAAIEIVETASFHLARGNSYLVTSDFRSALKDYEIALSLYVKSKKRPKEGSVSGNLGNAYHALGEYEIAIEYNITALEISREIADRREEGRSLGNLGNAYFAQGEYERAIEYHTKARKIAREVGDKKREGTALGNLGGAYDALGEYEIAIEYKTAALEISREIADRQGEGSRLSNLGNTYRFLGQYQKSIQYTTEALEIARQIGDRRGEGSRLCNLGIAYNTFGQYDKAIESLSQSLKIFEEIKSPYAEIVRGNLDKLAKYCVRIES